MKRRRRVGRLGSLVFTAVLSMGAYTVCDDRVPQPDLDWPDLVEGELQWPDNVDPPRGGGRTVLIDEMHDNLATRDGRFARLTALLEEDGYVVESLDAPDLTSLGTALANASVLIIGHPFVDWSPDELDVLMTHFRQQIPEQCVFGVCLQATGLGVLLVAEDPSPIPNLLARFGLQMGPLVGQSPANCPPELPGCPATWNHFERVERELPLRHPAVQDDMGDPPGDGVAGVVGFEFQRAIVTPDALWPPFHEVLRYGPSALQGTLFQTTPAEGFPLAVELHLPDLVAPLTASTPNLFRGRFLAVANLEMVTAVVHEDDDGQGGTALVDPVGFRAPGAQENARFVANAIHWLDPLIGRPDVSLSNQRVDARYQPHVLHPEHTTAPAPRIVVDHGHGNFHQIEPCSGVPLPPLGAGACRYEPLAELARADGFETTSTDQDFATCLAPGGDCVGATILLTVNPSAGSAITPAEAQAALEWVHDDGGSLFVVVDHSPYDAAEEILDGATLPPDLQLGIALAPAPARVALDPATGCLPVVPPGECPDTLEFFDFEAATVRPYSGLIEAHPVAAGRAGLLPAEDLRQVRSFGGTAFEVVAPLAGAVYESVLTLPAGAFYDGGPPGSLAGRSMGLAVELGAGRIFLISEASMLTSQKGGFTIPRGMQVHDAEDNERLALNILHWLDGTLGP